MIISEAECSDKKSQHGRPVPAQNSDNEPIASRQTRSHLPGRNLRGYSKNMNYVK